MLAIDDYRLPRVLVGCGLFGLEVNVSNFKGTKGRWFVDEDGDVCSTGRDNDLVAGVSGCHRTSEDEANANLIAAAPELLEALQDLLFLYKHDEGCRALTEYVRAESAIKKALGE